jgi:hypothetical protein
MKALQALLLIVAVLLLSIQSVRHLYIKYFETRASVLDQFAEEVTKEVNKDIEAAKTLDELVAKYAPARRRVDELDEMLDDQLKGKPEEERREITWQFHQEHAEEYDRASQLSYAIDDWESKARQVTETQVFWAFGLGLFLIGCVVYLKWRWLGLAFVIPGVAEMIWATSPSFQWGGTVIEFERLLNNKIVLTNVALVLVVVAWLVSTWIERRRRKTAAAAEAGVPPNP